MLNPRIWLQGGLLLGAVTVVMADSGFLPNLFPFSNPTGILKTFSTTGKVDLSGPFFQSLGTNGRSCATCHQDSDGWSVSAAHVAERFENTRGLDPIFRPNDGSNCDHDIDVSTVDGRRQAYSLLTSRGLIRIAFQRERSSRSSVSAIPMDAMKRRFCRCIDVRCLQPISDSSAR